MSPCRPFARTSELQRHSRHSGRVLLCDTTTYQVFLSPGSQNRTVRVVSVSARSEPFCLISPRIKSFSTPDLRTEESVSFLSAAEVSAIAKGAGHHLQGLACRAQSMGTFAGLAGCGPVYQPFVNGPVDHVTVCSIV